MCRNSLVLSLKKRMHHASQSNKVRLTNSMKTLPRNLRSEGNLSKKVNVQTVILNGIKN